MNIHDALILLQRRDDLFLRKRDRTEEWTLYVDAGNVFRKSPGGEEVALDARDCKGDDWYLVNAINDEVYRTKGATKFFCPACRTVFRSASDPYHCKGAEIVPFDRVLHGHLLIDGNNAWNQIISSLRIDGLSDPRWDEAEEMVSWAGQNGDVARVLAYIQLLQAK